MSNSSIPSNSYELRSLIDNFSEETKDTLIAVQEQLIKDFINGGPNDFNAATSTLKSMLLVKIITGSS